MSAGEVNQLGNRACAAAAATPIPCSCPSMSSRLSRDGAGQAGGASRPDGGIAKRVRALPPEPNRHPQRKADDGADAGHRHCSIDEVRIHHHQLVRLPAGAFVAASFRTRTTRIRCRSRRATGRGPSDQSTWVRWLLFLANRVGPDLCVLTCHRAIRFHAGVEVTQLLEIVQVLFA